MTMRLVGTPRVQSPFGKNSTIWFYDPGTLTPKDVYSDDAKTTPIDQTNGIAADQAGIWPEIVLDGSLYRVIVKDANGVTKQDVDNFDPGLAAGFGVTSTVGIGQGGTGATNASAARANLGAASSDALTQTQNTVTLHDTLINTGLHSDGDRFGLLAKEDVVTRALMEAGTGAFRLQRQVTTTVSDSSINTTTPAFDNSTPQVGEGEQFMSLAITPLIATSKIIVKAIVTFSRSTTPMDCVVAMFRNGAANAVAADGGSSQSTQDQIILDYEEAPGSTSTLTFTLRAGVNTGTMTIPGTNNLGGLRKCLLVAEEWVDV